MKVHNAVSIEDPRWAASLDVVHLADAVISCAIEEAGRTVEPGTEISLLFANDARTAALKSQWLGGQGPTNVLSFPAPAADLEDGEILLGDIVFSYDTIEREALDQGRSLEAHLAHMIAHGFLHLLGYDHINDEDAAEMEALETRILLALGFPDPWAQGEEL